MSKKLCYRRDRSDTGTEDRYKIFTETSSGNLNHHMLISGTDIIYQDFINVHDFHHEKKHIHVWTDHLSEYQIMNIMKSKWTIFYFMEYCINYLPVHIIIF